jgi:uncharacterized protein (TIGR03067 family)
LTVARNVVYISAEKPTRRWTVRFQMFLAVVAFLLLGFAPAPFSKPERTEQDLKKLQGEWSYPTTIYFTDWNGDFSIKPGPAVRVTIRGNRMIDHGSGAFSGVIRLDASRSPRVLDLIPEKAEYARYGIYKMEGDRLTLCFTTPVFDGPSERPKSFGARPWVWTRKDP